MVGKDNWKEEFCNNIDQILEARAAKKEDTLFKLNQVINKNNNDKEFFIGENGFFYNGRTKYE